MSTPKLHITSASPRCRYCEERIASKEEHFVWHISNTHCTQVHFHVDCASNLVSDFELVFH